MNTPKEWQIKRNLRWRHNGFSGSVAMALNAVRTIQNSPTATMAAKSFAREAEINLEKLQQAIKLRVNA